MDTPEADNLEHMCTEYVSMGEELRNLRQSIKERESHLKQERQALEDTILNALEENQSYQTSRGWRLTHQQNERPETLKEERVHEIVNEVWPRVDRSGTPSDFANELLESRKMVVKSFISVRKPTAKKRRKS